MFTWKPIYKELAQALLPFRHRQPELVDILEEIEKVKVRIPVIRLIDKPKPAIAPRLEVIDPFTFFANFNRGTTPQNRVAVLKIIKDSLQLKSEIPSDFSGLPTVDPQQSWFFPYPDKRKDNDVESLWDLAESVLACKPEQLSAELFNRCLEIHTVGVAKLTIGMFWINPDNYLALDSKNCAAFEAVDIDTNVTDYASYLKLLKLVHEKLGHDHSQISVSAWDTGSRRVQYWAGGSPSEFWQLGDSDVPKC